MSKIYRHIVTLPTGQFNTLMQDILKETPRGQQYIRQLADEIRGEEDGQQTESKAASVIRGLMEQ